MVKQEPRPDSYTASDLTKADLMAFLTYDPSTGVFTRNRDGKVLGTSCAKTRRVRIYIDGFFYLAHRLAWLYVKGEWPSGILDHRDRDAGNNRFKNLRPATRGQNVANSDATWSASGMRGVYYQAGTKLWRAKIGRISLGYFHSKEAAGAAYTAKAIELYGEFARAA